MRVRLRWTDPNYGETEHRVYRSESPMDPATLPAPLAVLPADTVDFTDATVADQTTYFYRVSAIYQGQEYLGAEMEVFADASAAKAIASSFDHLTLDASPDTYDAEITAYDAEMVATFRDGAHAEDTTRVAELTDWGQHKQAPATTSVGRMWILCRDNVTGDVLRVYAERAIDGTPDEVISTPETWTFEARWQGAVHTGTGTWELTNATAAFGNAALSSDDGAWALGDGLSLQGNMSRPRGDIWGVAAWDASDTSAVMEAGASSVSSDFQGLVVFAPLNPPLSPPLSPPTNLQSEYVPVFAPGDVTLQLV